MTMLCHQLTDAPGLTPCETDDALAMAGRPGSRLWFDAQDAPAAELEQLLDRLGVDGLARRLCREARDRPGFYPLHPFTFLVIPAQAAPGSGRDVEHLALVFRDDLLLTLRERRETHPQWTDVLREAGSWLPDGTVPGLVSAVLIAISLRCLQRTAGIRDSIMALEARMDREPERIEMTEISRARSELLVLEAIASGQLPLVQAVQAAGATFSPAPAARQYVSCAVANLEATDRSIHRLESRLEVIRSLYDMHAQEKTNRRLGRLTILSVIFMPMTLLAAIWGMNFRVMPELAWPAGYPLALGAMVLIGALLFAFFRRRGWFE